MSILQWRIRADERAQRMRKMSRSGPIQHLAHALLYAFGPRGLKFWGVRMTADPSAENCAI